MGLIVLALTAALVVWVAGATLLEARNRPEPAEPLTITLGY